jgi:outer membrane protein assembly factor BamB
VQLTAVRQRSCPACERPVAARSARWCGGCGAPLRPVAASDEPDASPSTGAGTGRRRVALVALGVAVVAALLLVGGPIVDRLPGDDTAIADLEVASPSARVLERVATRFQPPPPALAAPVCLRAAGLDCFRWAVDEADAGRAHTQLAGDLLLSTSFGGGELTARHLSDGRVAWRTSVSSDRVVATDQLLLTVDDGVLRARTLEDGQVRWRSDELPDDVTFLAAEQRGAELVLIAFLDAPILDDGTTVGPLATILGVDAADGQVRWRTDAVGPAAIAPDATVAFVDAEGDLVAVERDGSERWRVPAVTPGSAGGTWITAGIVTVYSGEDGGDRLHRLADGRALGVGGTALAGDAERTLLEVWPGQDIGASSEDVEHDGPAYVLLDADGEPRWQVPADQRGCTIGAELDADEVRIAGCGGAELVLDAADGQVLSRTPPLQANDGVVTTFAERVGPYALQPEAPSQLASAYLLVDTRTDQQVARLPPDSVALTRAGETAWTHDLGGIAVVQHRGGLVALDLPRDGARLDRPSGGVTSR